MSWLDENGKLIRLGREFATGGEGKLYEVANDPTSVAKIYLPDRAAGKTAKLRHLRELQTKGLHQVAVLPTSLLFDVNNRQVARGFIMPLVKGKEIHRLYGPHDRYVEFPSAAWDFLIHVAKNSAAAFQTLHEHGVVMADVNEKNLLVTSSGYVRLIDCDSYQFFHSSGVFHCDVGVPLWTPPELQGRDFRGLVRTKNHDRFGLAVLMFQLLFMGRHPFAGVPDRPEQFEIEKAISQFLFAFTPKTRSLGIRPPPHALPLSVLPNNLVQLFERAFLRGSERDSGRPSGGDWFLALDFLSKSLRGCSRDPGHKYPSHLAECPWCEIYDAGGPNFFISVVVHVAPEFAAANVKAYWAAIQQISPRPLVTRELAAFGQPKVTAMPLPSGMSKTRPQFYVGWLIIAASVPLFWVVGCFAAIGIFIGWGLIAEGSRSSEYTGEASRRRQAAEQAETEIQKSLTDAKKIVTDYQRQFGKKKAELQAAYSRYLRLDQEQRAELHGLEANKRELQLKEYLDRQLISGFSIDGIGPKRTATLKAYGIESALDVNRHMSVPGIGNTLVDFLLQWKYRCEMSFRYDPSKPMPPAEMRTVELKIADLRRSLEMELRSGPQSLSEISVTAERKLRECEARAASMIQKQAQARADAALCS